MGLRRIIIRVANTFDRSEGLRSVYQRLIRGINKALNRLTTVL